MKSFRRVYRILFASIFVGALCAVSGCIVIPTPDKASGTSTRANIAPDVIETLNQPGVTRADVLLRLANPTSCVNGELYYLYRWKTSDAWGGVCPYGCIIGGELTGTARFLVFEFDEEDLVTSAQLFEAATFNEAREKMRSWMKLRMGENGNEAPCGSNNP